MKKILNKIFVIFLSTCIVNPFFISSSYATLRTPTWYDSNSIGTTPDWHYRVPITVPSGTSINSTIKLDVDFQALLAQMGVSGVFDVNSPRVVRSSGALSTTQEYTPTLYNSTTNSTAGRGEIKFLSQDSGPYYLYFDIVANGVKPVNPQTTIDGNFEKGAVGQAQPPSWNAPTLGASIFDAQVRPNETVTVSTDGGLSKNTNGNAYTGSYSYLLGSRTNAEPSGFAGSGASIGATITKTITVPATNPGNLTFRYRLEGWDSTINGNVSNFDYFQAQIGSTLMVSPALNNYTTLPFTPNYGITQATQNVSGYGIYNGFDTDLQRRHKLGMTITQGAEPWFFVTQSLAAYAGQTITLTFFTYHSYLYKTWVSIDDVEWSIVSGTLGVPEAFGIKVLYPSITTNATAGVIVPISAQIDADPSSKVTANIYDNTGTLVASNISLYSNGTHGSSISTPNIWTNNGTDAANPTYTIPITANTSNSWLIRVFNRDASTSTIGATNGSVHIPGKPIAEIMSNYYNIDEINFSVKGKLSFTNVKTVSILKDPINGTTNPKAIPGADVLYNILVTSTSGGNPDINSMIITDAIPTNTQLYVSDLGITGTGPINFIDGTPSSGLTYTYAGLGNTNTNVTFSKDNGTTWNYIPVANTNGYDALVTNIKINPQGIMNGTVGASNPNFNLQFRVGIK